MATPSLCSECRSANRAGLLFCVVCGRRLPRGAFPADRIQAVARPGPEVLAVTAKARTSTLTWAAVLFALLAWSALPVLGAAFAVLLALRAQEEAEASPQTEGGEALIRLALWLGGVQLVLLLVAGAALGTAALVALWRAS